MTDATIFVIVIGGLVQALKIAGLPKDLAPLTAVLVGVGISFLFAGFIGNPVSEIIFYGIIGGLMASGLYDNVEKTLKGIKAIAK